MSGIGNGGALVGRFKKYGINTHITSATMGLMIFISAAIHLQSFVLLGLLPWLLRADEWLDSG